MNDAAQRGRHKIFLGMAAGVGKTYRMLQEGRAEAEAGRDVVIGYLEAHGRAETTAQAEGLEELPRRTVQYRETTLTEMDLPGILRRAPELCLIDELAHTNAPGLEHAKRWEDVDTVLDAGIDVYSTVNVQHLESLNDQIAELTGTRVRETVPDAVLAQADDVMVMDITPTALIERLKAGKVYPAERVDGALRNFFTTENLASLREVSLRQVAEEIENRRNAPGVTPVVSRPGTDGRDERLLQNAVPWAIGERLLALVVPAPASQRIVRRAWRSAQRLGAELDVLWVAPMRPPSDQDSDQTEQLNALRSLTSVLGAHLLIEHGDEVADIVTRVACERGTTYMLMGPPKPRNRWKRLTSPPLADVLLQTLPGVDLRIVADRAQRRGPPSTGEPERQEPEE